MGDAPQFLLAAVYAADRITLHAYDPVAYFTTGTPTPGRDFSTYDWQGATDRFASAEHQALIQTHHEQYLRMAGTAPTRYAWNRIADIASEC
jgi:hypothetical protein